MSLGPRIASFVHRSARVSTLIVLGLLSHVWAQTDTLPDGMRYVMTGAIEVMGGVASGPSLTAVPVSRDDDGAWTYAGDLDAALRGQPSADADAACLIHFGARVSTPGASDDPDPIIEFSGVIPGGLQEHAIYPVVPAAEPPDGGAWGLYGREWAQPGAFLLRVADLVPSDRGPTYTLFRGALGTVTVVSASAERTELAFSTSLVQVAPAVEEDDDPASSAQVALQLAGTFAQANRSAAIEVGGSVGALAGDVSGDWYLCGGAPSTEQLARAAEGRTPDARTPEVDEDGSRRDAAASESATTASPEAELDDPEPLGPTTRSQAQPPAPAPPPLEPDAASSDVPDRATADVDADAADVGDTDGPELIADDPSLPATCGGMPQRVWSGLISADAQNLVIETEGETCRISFERTDPEDDTRWWRRSGISHVALPSEDGSVRFQVYGDGLRGEGIQHAGSPRRMTWTVRSR